MLAVSRHTAGARIPGFTLIELLMVLVIASLLLGLGSPSMREAIEGYQLRSTANEFVAALHFTRNEAIARGAVVLLTPAGDGTDWNQGWQAFIDRDGNRRPGAGEPVLLRHGPAAAALRIWSRFSANTGPLYIAYNSAGRSCKASTGLGAHFGTVSLQAGVQQRNIKINMLGRVRLCDPAHEATGCTPASS